MFRQKKKKINKINKWIGVVISVVFFFLFQQLLEVGTQVIFQFNLFNYLFICFPPLLNFNIPLTLATPIFNHWKEEEEEKKRFLRKLNLIFFPPLLFFTFKTIIRKFSHFSNFICLGCCLTFIKIWMLPGFDRSQFFVFSIYFFA